MTSSSASSVFEDGKENNRFYPSMPVISNEDSHEILEILKTLKKSWLLLYFASETVPYKTMKQRFVF